MFSRKLRDEEPGSVSSLQRLRPSKSSFKHRFDLDDKEEETPARPPSPKRRLITFAPFFSQSVRSDFNDSFSDAGRSHHRPRRSSSPESPLVEELQDKYSDLRLALHSDAIAKLEAAQEEMTTEATTSIKSNREAIAKLDAVYSKIISPISQAQVKTDYVTDTPSGSQRGGYIEMSKFVPEFETRVNAAASELERLWVDWEEAQAEIEAFGKGLLVSDGVDAEDVHQGKTFASKESEHRKAVDEFESELRSISNDSVKEMKLYEKQLMKQIEGEASKIVQSFVVPGFR